MSDGTVPSLEQFASLKKQMGRQPVSPLAEKERKQKTLEQYLRLQSMVTGEQSLVRV